LAGRLCLEVYDRAWVPQLPYTLWSAVTDRAPHADEFPAEELALFRLLAQLAGGWVGYDAEEGPVFVNASAWRRTFSTWERSGRAA